MWYFPIARAIMVLRHRDDKSIFKVKNTFREMRKHGIYIMKNRLFEIWLMGIQKGAERVWGVKYENKI